MLRACLPNGSHGDERPPESFADTFAKTGWKLIWVVLHILNNEIGNDDERNIPNVLTSIKNTKQNEQKFEVYLGYKVHSTVEVQSTKGIYFLVGGS